MKFLLAMHITAGSLAIIAGFMKPIRFLPLLAIPAFLPLLLLIYWLVRVSFTEWYRRRVDSFKPALVGRSA
jgi:hypothetical protein